MEYIRFIAGAIAAGLVEYLLSKALPEKPKIKHISAITVALAVFVCITVLTSDSQDNLKIATTLPPATQVIQRPTSTIHGKNSSQLSQTPEVVIVTATSKPSSTASYDKTVQTQAQTPDNFIQNYYTTINQREYELAFSLLSASFKTKYHCCDANGSYSYSDYVDWWNSVKEIEVQKVEIREQSSSRATVYALLRFHYKDGRIVDDQHIFQLVSDGNGGWQIDEQGG